MAKLKVKTRKSAKKRFSITGSGKLRMQGAGFAHLMEGKDKKETKRKMRLKDVPATELHRMRTLLPVGIKGRQIKVNRTQKKEAR